MMMTNTTPDHKSRAHALYSPSSMARIVKCPWSVYIGRDIPEPTATSNAAEGTKAHEAAEIYLEAKLEGTPYPKMDKDVYDAEMLVCAKHYAEWVYKICKPHLDKPHYWAIERKLVVSLHKNIWGTTDFIMVYRDAEGNKHVILIDYKYGMWEVDVTNNWQVATYLYGAKNAFEGDGCMLSAQAYIYQPRAYQEALSTYKPNCWEITYDDLHDLFFSVIDDTVEIINDWFAKEACSKADTDLYTATGEHCHFCKAKGVCNAYKDKHSGPTLAAFKRVSSKLKKADMLDRQAIQNAGVIALDDIAFIALNAGVIKAFVDAVATIPAAMIMKGKKVPGCKLIEQNPRRKWLSNEQELIKGLRLLGVDNPTTTVTKVITITAIEKQLGKDKRNIEHLIQPNNDKSYKLVPKDHKSSASEFGASTSIVFAEAAKRMKAKKETNN